MSKRSLKAMYFALSEREAVEVYNNAMGDFLVETMKDIKDLPPFELDVTPSDLDAGLRHTFECVQQDRRGSQGKAKLVYRDLDNKVRLIFY